MLRERTCAIAVARHGPYWCSSMGAEITPGRSSRATRSPTVWLTPPLPDAAGLAATHLQVNGLGQACYHRDKASAARQKANVTTPMRAFQDTLLYPEQPRCDARSRPQRLVCDDGLVLCDARPVPARSTVPYQSHSSGHRARRKSSISSAWKAWIFTSNLYPHYSNFSSSFYLASTNVVNGSTVHMVLSSCDTRTPHMTKQGPHPFSRRWKYCRSCWTTACSFWGLIAGGSTPSAVSSKPGLCRSASSVACASRQYGSSIAGSGCIVRWGSSPCSRVGRRQH